MKYYLFKVGEKEYKLRLSAAAVVDTEKRLGKSIVDVLSECEERKLPKLGDLIIILYGSLQKFHSDINIKDAYDIFDEFADNGGNITELIKVITEVLSVSGFFKQTEQERVTESA